MLRCFGKNRFCPVCGKSSGHFRRYGLVPREDAQCVHCKALERHRLVWLFMQKNTNLFDTAPKKMLHVAPEDCFESRFKELLGDGYVTADLFQPSVMVKMDVTEIPYEEQSFDVIICSHVLEHVSDDKKAMRELFRVLKNNGWAVLLVPIKGDKTLECPSIVKPEDRLKVFGQKDHVRTYGLDYIDRLCEAGFTVEVAEVSDIADREDAVRMGLTSGSGRIFYCTKPVSAN